MEERLAEANRVRPTMELAVIKLEKFLHDVTAGYVNKPQVVERHGHETIRFVTQHPCDAVLMKFARVVSLCRAMLLLMDAGYIQEQAIIQRSIEETNEDIFFLVVNITESGESDRFNGHLSEFWKEDYENPNEPLKTKIPRAFSRRGISSFLHRVFGQPNPSLADEVHNSIYSMYSGFTHGAAPHIMEIYDFEERRFLTQGLLGTNRHLDYVIDGTNSIYRSIVSACALSKAFGVAELHRLSRQIEEWFIAEIGKEKLH